MQFLLPMLATIATGATVFVLAPARPESFVVRSVIDGRTIDVEQFGRVRLLDIEIPAVVATAARDRLSGLVLRRWVRLETAVDDDAIRTRRVAYVVTGDGVCANTVLVRDGLARVSAHASGARRAELEQAEDDARRLENGLWGYTRRPQPNKRRSSWPRFPSSTHRNARFATATNFITVSTIGRSGSSSSSSPRGR